LTWKRPIRDKLGISHVTITENFSNGFTKQQRRQLYTSEVSHSPKQAQTNRSSKGRGISRN